MILSENRCTLFGIMRWPEGFVSGGQGKSINGASARADHALAVEPVKAGRADYRDTGQGPAVPLVAEDQEAELDHRHDLGIDERREHPGRRETMRPDQQEVSETAEQAHRAH